MTAPRDGIAALAAQMAAHGTERDAPVRAVMALLGDRWTTLILLVLGMGAWRHAELKRVLAQLSAEQAISQRVLTLKLRTLERDGFVARSVTGDVPPRVSYTLTALGQGLLAQAQGLIGWIQEQSGPIRAARARFDADA
ncbi:winged helix-turn-helix transcriptional regulator [Novosphingobium sp. B 225]|uniref:winged helix-turn-helix transcriptional regulator n=1 Tax=Novosphingobium sp. B 225 TaxID=1961849 RepID=UPI000B4AF15E|nr:helix-turn-helix domain-containing protein [Novosphingobium sp. B 225]